MKTSAGMAALLAGLMLATATGCAGNPRSAANRTAEQPVADNAVNAGVRGAITAEPVLKGSEIQVDTVNGVVQLSGYVSSADDVATAAAVARTVKGVKSVRNDLRLK
jgi:osmotically-inducible protein OsmY